MPEVFVEEGVGKFEDLIRRAISKLGRGAHVDSFLKIDGIEGESTDSKHAKEIALIAYELGVSQRGTAGSQTGGAGAGKAKIRDSLFVAKLDKANINLHLACINGKHIGKANFVVRKAGETPQDYYHITYSDFIVSEFYVVDSESEDQLPLMCFALNFAKIEAEYKPQDAKGGLGGAVKMGWDLAKNEKV